eukprot:COSAG01_NODE_2199_length_8180_cov_7.460262_11_plen_118_part_00
MSWDEDSRVFAGEIRWEGRTGTTCDAACWLTLLIPPLGRSRVAAAWPTRPAARGGVVRLSSSGSQRACDRWQGAARWIYRLVFDPSLLFIAQGSVTTSLPGGVLATEEPRQFGRDLV